MITRKSTDIILTIINGLMTPKTFRNPTSAH